MSPVSPRSMPSGSTMGQTQFSRPNFRADMVENCARHHSSQTMAILRRGEQPSVPQVALAVLASKRRALGSSATTRSPLPLANAVKIFLWVLPWALGDIPRCKYISGSNRGKWPEPGRTNLHPCSVCSIGWTMLGLR